MNKEQWNQALGSMLQEAMRLQRLPEGERQDTIIDLSLTIAEESTRLYEAVLAVIYALCCDAVLQIRTDPLAYAGFLQSKDELIKLIPIEDRPEAINEGVYERLGEIILGEESTEPTF